jgi:hypothetical protein
MEAEPGSGAGRGFDVVQEHHRLGPAAFVARADQACDRVVALSGAADGKASRLGHVEALTDERFLRNPAHANPWPAAGAKPR